VTRYLLDSTVLIRRLRGEEDVLQRLLRLVDEGHEIGTSCVNIAEIERGARPGHRRRAASFMGRLEFFATTREAAERAGRYQATFAGRGRTIHTADALVAGTARAYGAVLVTDDLDDFPMRDLRVISPAAM